MLILFRVLIYKTNCKNNNRTVVFSAGSDIGIIRELIRVKCCTSRKRTACVTHFLAPDVAEYLKPKLKNIERSMVLVKTEINDVNICVQSCKLSIRKKRKAGIYVLSAKICVRRTLRESDSD